MSGVGEVPTSKPESTNRPGNTGGIASTHPRWHVAMNPQVEFWRWQDLEGGFTIHSESCSDPQNTPITEVVGEFAANARTAV